MYSNIAHFKEALSLFINQEELYGSEFNLHVTYDRMGTLTYLKAIRKLGDFCFFNATWNTHVFIVVVVLWRCQVMTNICCVVFLFSAPGPKVDDSKKLWLLIAIATGSTVFVLAVVVIAIVAVTKKRQDKLIYLALHADAIIRVHT